eukprot:9901880-Alexandrium_andersonii.AAC.1
MARRVFADRIDVVARPWGLRRDGDLWEVFHRVASARAFRGVAFTKVKGHATEQHIREGRSTRRDANLNSVADAMAERGVRSSAHSQEIWTWWNHNVARYHVFVFKVQHMLVSIFERSIKGR